MVARFTDTAQHGALTVPGSVTPLIAIETDLMGAVAGKVARRTTLAARLDLPVVIETQLILTKSQVTRHTSVVKADPVVAQSGPGAGVSLKVTTTTGVDGAVRQETVLDRRVRELMGRVINGEEK